MIAKLKMPIAIGRIGIFLHLHYIKVNHHLLEGELHMNDPENPSAVWIGLRRTTGTESFRWMPSGVTHDQVHSKNNATRLCGAYQYYNTNGALALNCALDRRRNIFCESGIL